MQQATVSYLSEHRHDEAGRSLWTSICIGFRVVGDAGDLGTVVDLERTPGAPGPDLLLVRTGRVRHRLVRIPLADVAFADVLGERLYLAEPYRTLPAA